MSGNNNSALQDNTTYHHSTCGNILSHVGEFLPTERQCIQYIITTGHSNRFITKCREALQNSFWHYAQVHADNTQSNSAMISRTVGAISLGSTGNIQSTYKFMSLLTGKLIKARSFTPLPMPEEVIKQVEEMASVNYLSKQGQAEAHLDALRAYGESQ
jgi:hypothetical protein